MNDELRVAPARTDTGVPDASPLTRDWRETLTEEAGFSEAEIRGIYHAGLLDAILSRRSDDPEAIGWEDWLPRLWIRPWFYTLCRPCRLLKLNSIGSLTQALNGGGEEGREEGNGSSYVIGLGTSPAAAFDPVHRNFIIVREKNEGEGGSNIYARLVGEDGTSLRVTDTPISVERPTHGCLSSLGNAQLRERNLSLPDPAACRINTDPAVAYNNGRFLITWTKTGRAPQGGSFSVILGKMVSAETLQPAEEKWREGLMLSKFSIASPAAGEPPRSDAELQAWSLEGRSHVAPFFGAGAGEGSFLMVWDSNKDFISCRDPLRRGATGIYGRAVSSAFTPDPPSGRPNPDVFRVYADPSTMRAECAPDADVTRAVKPRVAYLSAASQFLTVFETFKNVSPVRPSVSGSVVTLTQELRARVSNAHAFTNIDNQIHEGCFDPDVAAAADRFLVVDSVGRESLKLTPVGLERGLPVPGDPVNYADPDGKGIHRPRLAINRIMGQEGEGVAADAQYVVAFESLADDNLTSQISALIFSANYVPMEIWRALQNGFSANRHVALAPAGPEKMMAVWNGIDGSESQVLASVLELRPAANTEPRVEISSVENHSGCLPPGETVELNGCNSRDAQDDGDHLTYHWAQEGGTPGVFEFSDRCRTQYTAPNVGAREDFDILLTVTDRGGMGATGRLRLCVNPRQPQNNPPTAAISETSDPGVRVTSLMKPDSAEADPWAPTRVTLSGHLSSHGETRPPYQTLTYEWQLMNPDDVSIGNVSEYNNVTFSFTLPRVRRGEAAKVVVIRLTVDDNSGEDNHTAWAEVQITVNGINHHPTAPVLIEPANNMILPPSRVKAVWGASVDPDTAEGDSLVYNVFWGSTDNPTTPVPGCQGIESQECLFGGDERERALLPDTTYWWKVVARDRLRVNTVSASRSFQTNGDVGLVHWWSFEEDGPTTSDRSGFEKEGRLMGGAYRVESPAGRAVRFNCTSGNAYVEMPEPMDVPLGDRWTASFWINLDNLNLQTFLTVGDKRSGEPGRNYFELLTNNGDIAINYYGRDGTLAQLRSNNIVLHPGRWQHIALTKSGSAGVGALTLFVHGTVQPIHLSGGTVTAQRASPRQISFGRELAGERYVCGRADELMLFDRPLSPQEINALCWRHDPAGTLCNR